MRAQGVVPDAPRAGGRGRGDRRVLHHARGCDENPPHFLWNAKMRFGKTFTAYQLAKRLGWTRVLVLTYKPAVETAWREDLEVPHATSTGGAFKGKDDPPVDLDDPAPLVWFASVPGRAGHRRATATRRRRTRVSTSSTGTPSSSTSTTSVRGVTLHAACTSVTARTGIGGDASEKRCARHPGPRRGLRARTSRRRSPLNVRATTCTCPAPRSGRSPQGEFLEDQVYNWTYSDEQRAKADMGRHQGPNPYAGAAPRCTCSPTRCRRRFERWRSTTARSSPSPSSSAPRSDDTATPQFIHEAEVQKWLRPAARPGHHRACGPTCRTRHRPPLPYEDTNLLQRPAAHRLVPAQRRRVHGDVETCCTASHNTFYRDYNVIVAAGSEGRDGREGARPGRRTRCGRHPTGLQDHHVVVREADDRA
ncbi:MAG: hypothetical protein V9E94_19250 [Microthrixaceae bacterium]